MLHSECCPLTALVSCDRFVVFMVHVWWLMASGPRGSIKFLCVKKLICRWRTRAGGPSTVSLDLWVVFMWAAQVKSPTAVSPDFVLLSGYDGFVFPDGGAVLAPADLRGRVGVELHRQPDVLLQLDGNVLRLCGLHIHIAPLWNRKKEMIGWTSGWKVRLPLKKTTKKNSHVSEHCWTLRWSCRFFMVAQLILVTVCWSHMFWCCRCGRTVFFLGFFSSIISLKYSHTIDKHNKNI